jgi:hypothetical protein
MNLEYPVLMRNDGGNQRDKHNVDSCVEWENGAEADARALGQDAETTLPVPPPSHAGTRPARMSVGDYETMHTLLKEYNDKM